MKKTFVSALLLLASFSFSFAQEDDEQNPPASDISLEEIAEEFDTAGESLESSDSEVIVNSESSSDNKTEDFEEEAVFDAEVEEGESNQTPLIPDNFWRGKVSVASENEYPKGFFAMAKGYFPGDSLAVVNGKTQESVNVLIIGTIDQTSETGIKFSQEAASALKISDQTDASVVLDERINPPEVREAAGAKLIIFGMEDKDTASFEQPLSLPEDEAILLTTAPANDEPEVVNEIPLSESAEDTSVLLPLEVVPFDEAELDAMNPPEVNEENIESSDTDAYAPIVLEVPETEAEPVAEEIVPEETELPEEITLSEEVKVEKISEPENEGAAEQRVELPLHQEPEPEVVVCEPAPKPAKSYAPAEKKSSVPYKSLIANEKMVRSGYYIQLTFLTKEEYLQNFADKYNGDYKLFYIPHKNGYKILAGVFTRENKDFALESVKKSGFKDAFIKELGK